MHANELLGSERCFFLCRYYGTTGAPWTMQVHLRGISPVQGKAGEDLASVLTSGLSAEASYLLPLSLLKARFD